MTSTRPAPAGALADSAHLEAARRARRRTPAWAAVLLTVVIWFVSQIVSPPLPDTSGGALRSAVAFLPVLVVGYALRILLVWLWVARYEGRSFRSLGFPRGGLGAAGRGFAVGVLLFAVVVGVLALLGVVTTKATAPGLSGAATLGGVLLLLVGWLVQGSAEEITLRGFVLQSLGRSRVRLGIAVSALLFAVGHVDALGSPVAILNLLLFGVFTALWALREGGLWGVCAFHGAWNWVEGSVTGLAVSGKDVPGGSLVALRTHGATLLSGGEFGVEASIVVSLVLAAGVALLLRRQDGRPE